MKIIKVNCEFASELVCVIPYVYWLHQNNQLEKVITSRGMTPFYYFCDNVEERFEYRTFDVNVNGLKDVPNEWIHHNALSVFGRPFSELTEDEESEVHGVLDYSEWVPPPYKDYYQTDQFNHMKPYIVVNNNYNIESANMITESRRYFDITTLNNIFNYLEDVGYSVIYKRPNNTEFAPDQNEMMTLEQGIVLRENTTVGVMSDYEMCDYYSNVHNMDGFDYGDDYSYNEFQLECFSGASGFITPNGGGGILCSYFQKPVLFYVPRGKELRPRYLTKENSYIKKLSDADIHVVLDEGDINDYSKLITKMKDVFK